MKKQIFTLILFSLFSATACKTSEVKKDVQVISFAKLQEIMSSKEDNRVYIYNFWATWCAPCVKELPHFDKVVRDMGKEVKMVLISQNEEKELIKVQEYLDENHYRADNYLLEKGNPNIWMPMLNKEWSGAIPMTIIKYGDKEFFHEGKMSEEYLRNEIKKIKNEK